MSNEGGRHAYRDELGAAYERIATLERELAQRSSEDPAANLRAWLEQERARIAARGPTKLTRAQRALPNIVTVPFGAFAFACFLIGLWWLALLVIALGVAISWSVRTLVRWHADTDRRVVLRIDERVAELARLPPGASTASIAHPSGSRAETRP